jgi:hypothetical protein
VFLDVEDIGGGERWKEALRQAHAEIRKSEDFGIEILVVLLRDLTFT